MKKQNFYLKDITIIFMASFVIRLIQIVFMIFKVI